MEAKIRGSLQGKQPKNPWDDEELLGQAKRLRHTTGTIMLKPEWVKNDFDRQHLVNVANKVLGEVKP